MKIVYCYNSVGTRWGSELVTAVKANALSIIDGNDVWVVVSEQTEPANTILLPDVHYIDLGVRYEQVHQRFPLNYPYILSKRILHRKNLKTLLNSIQPDVVISPGGAERKIIPFLRGRWVTIRECHTISDTHKFRTTTLEKTKDLIGQFVEFKLFSKLYDHFVVLSEEDKMMYWKNSDRVSVIANPVRFHAIQLSPLTAKRVISVGRLCKEKDFSTLIHIFRLVVNQHPDWELHIFGEGPERKALTTEIKNLGLEGHVFLDGFINDVQNEMRNASIYVCTPQFEGFGMAILEAMACGIPIVSTDCPYGPRALIEDRVSGYLIPAGHNQEMADKISLLINNPNLRRQMGADANNASIHYSLDSILSRWMELFQTLVTEKHQKERRKNR